MTSVADSARVEPVGGHIILWKLVSFLYLIPYLDINKIQCQIKQGLLLQSLKSLCSLLQKIVLGIDFTSYKLKQEVAKHSIILNYTATRQNLNI